MRRRVLPLVGFGQVRASLALASIYKRALILSYVTIDTPTLSIVPYLLQTASTSATFLIDRRTLPNRKTRESLSLQSIILPSITVPSILTTVWSMGAENTPQSALWKLQSPLSATSLISLRNTPCSNIGRGQWFPLQLCGQAQTPQQVPGNVGNLLPSNSSTCPSTLHMRQSNLWPI